MIWWLNNEVYWNEYGCQRTTDSGATEWVRPCPAHGTPRSAAPRNATLSHYHSPTHCSFVPLRHRLRVVCSHLRLDRGPEHAQAVL